MPVSAGISISCAPGIKAEQPVWMPAVSVLFGARSAWSSAERPYAEAPDCGGREHFALAL